ncbi:MAG: C45 family peptidase [Bacteroidota bacterium]
MNSKQIQNLSFLILLFLLGCQGQKQDTGVSSSANASLELLADQQLRRIYLEGTAFERGLQHGNLLRKEIKAVTDSLLLDIGKTTGEKPITFIKNFLKETDFVASMQKWTPELLEEIKGISEGSAVPYDIILMHQLGDEFFFSTKYLFAHKCSSIGINKTQAHPSITAQNMDIPTYFHGYQTVMNIKKKKGKELLVLTIPGHIGITGMNNSSISINCNILMQLTAQSKGLPVSAIVRGVLAQTNYDAAIDWIKQVEHASGQNYIIGGKEAVVSLECSADSIVEFIPFENANYTYHTNHPLKNKDYSDWYLNALEENGFTLFDAKGFCQRFPSFEKRFNETVLDFSVEEIQEVLRSKDHTGFDVMSNSYTYASVIYLLSDQPHCLIAPGKPHEREYLTLFFSDQTPK